MAPEMPPVAVAAPDAARLCQLATLLRQLHCAFECADLVEKLDALLESETEDWETWKVAAVTVISYNPAHEALIRTLLEKFRGGDYSQQVEALHLLCEAAPAAQLRDEVTLV